jgi:hypothetical protein
MANHLRCRGCNKLFKTDNQHQWHLETHGECLRRSSNIGIVHSESSQSSASQSSGSSAVAGAGPNVGQDSDSSQSLSNNQFGLSSQASSPASSDKEEEEQEEEGDSGEEEVEPILVDGLLQVRYDVPSSETSIQDGSLARHQREEEEEEEEEEEDGYSVDSSPELGHLELPAATDGDALHHPPELGQGPTGLQVPGEVLGDNDVRFAYQGLYDKKVQHGVKGYAQAPMEKETQHLVKLLHLMKTHGAPLGLFDEVVSWCEEANESAGLFVDGAPPMMKRTPLLRELTKRFNLGGLKPIQTSVWLPNAGVHLNVTTHDAQEAIVSLLMDPELMKDENLLFFNQDNPFAPPAAGPLPEDHLFADINTGQDMRDGYNFHCKIRGRDILVPIMFFIDKTHTDLHGNLCQEPVSFTLGILNRETRNNPRAWRSLGYIPNQSVHTTAAQALGKLSDYHVVLKHILKGLLDLQKEGGFRWKFKYKDKIYDAVFVTAFFCLTGDTEGQDKASGRYSCRTGNVYCLCRYCDIPASQTGNTNHAFKLTKQSQVDELVKRKDTEQLKKMSRHCLSHGNAFEAARFCAEVGICEATPAELLHTTQLGLHKYAKEGFADSKKQKKGARRTVPDPEEVPDTITEAPSAADLEKYYVMSPSRIKVTERVLTELGFLLQQQSDRDLPRTYFPSGVTNLTKINAHEQEGTLLLFLLLLCSGLGSYWFNDKDKDQTNMNANLGLLGDERTANWIWVFEGLMYYEEFQKDDHTKAEVDHFEVYIGPFLDRYGRVVDRQKGQKLNIVKYHLPRHQPEDIRRYGCARNVDSSVGESNHKTNVKGPAQRTQRRSHLLDQQSATRYVENLCIDAAHLPSPPKATSTTPALGCLSKPHNVVRSTGIYLCNTTKASADKEVHWPEVALQKDLGVVLKRILGSLDPARGFVTLHKTYRDQAGVLYRADPSWTLSKGNVTAKHGWHDWAYAGDNPIDENYAEDNARQTPCHLMCFISVGGVGEEAVDINGTLISEDGDYALCHMVTGKGEPYWLRQECKMINGGAKKHVPRTNAPILLATRVENISGPCIAVPNYVVQVTRLHKRKNVSIERSPVSYLFVKPRCEWSRQFKEWAKQHCDEQAEIDAEAAAADARAEAQSDLEEEAERRPAKRRRRRRS